MKDILNFLYEHKTLSKAEAKEILKNIAQGRYNHSQIASFISVYLMRSITVDELTGFRDALLDLCIPVSFDGMETIDVCGTGGDGKDTFNISTLSAFVIAGAGVKVSKHGNYGISSTCGSSNVIEQLGYRFSTDEPKLQSEIEKAGISFLHAPLFNPAMKNVAPVRKDLGVKTFFNMLGPMVNPSRPSKQMIGVYSLELARIYTYLYQNTDKDFVIVHSLDGYDEISLTGDFKILTRDMEKIMQPDELGLQQYNPGELSGGVSVADAARIFKSVLEGKGTRAQNEVVIANAGLGLKAYYPEKNIFDCVGLARESLESGMANSALNTLIGMNK
jgi:anthranilate phosphoribosyltransferase